MSPLYGDMTKEEVAKEFARLIVPKLREMLAKEELKKKKVKNRKKKQNSSSDRKLQYLILLRM